VAALFPVHGFVLAGGKSSRMGKDKALLEFRGRPLVAIAVETLRSFCEEVSISGNRDDLKNWAPVVHEDRVSSGPAAGIEAGLLAAQRNWVMFIPVDVPLVPAALLREWVEAVHRKEEGCRASYLLVHGERQPAFCMLRKDCADVVTEALNDGKRSIADIFASVSTEKQTWLCEVTGLASQPTESELDAWFCNVNTPEDLALLWKSIDDVAE
jgi:molybdopterin-guanine dinucleotide biosynthesis protein A